MEFDRLRHRMPELIGINGAKQSAVALSLLPTENGYDVLFEVRSAKVDSQPGDVCFPGGMMEPGEATEETAVRETMEELLIDRAQIEVIAPLDYVFTGTLAIYPYLVVLHDYQGTYSEDEVAEVFRVPLSFFCEHEPEEYIVRAQPKPDDDFPFDRVVGGRDYGWRPRKESVYFYEYEGRTIWGLTAKILHAFTQLIEVGGF